MKKTMVIKLLGTLAIVAALAAMCIAPLSASPAVTTRATAQDSNTTVTPPGIPTLTTTGFMMKANMHLTDLTGVNSTTKLPICRPENRYRCGRGRCGNT